MDIYNYAAVMYKSCKHSVLFVDCIVHSYADSGTNYRHMAVFHISQWIVHRLLLCKYQYVVAEIS